MNSKKHGSIELYIKRFDKYLDCERGLVVSYRNYCCHIAKQFLQSQFKTKSVCINLIKPSDVTAFVFSYARNESPKRTQRMSSALRSFLRFLRLDHHLNIDFSNLILPVAVWKKDQIPSYLTNKEVKAVLNQCDRTSAKGLRDYTIMKTLSSLGLRASEVVKLTLDDIDWHNGELVVRGKGGRISRLPLTQELGNDLATYLIQGRPSLCTCRNFFVSIRPPSHGISVQTVSNIVSTVLKDAGLAYKKGASHLFRHTLATQLLQKGATLSEIAEILRHQSIDTTEIYAKVDFRRLRALAPAWPQHWNFGGSI